MRRLWAYIIVVFAALVAVFASFPAVMRGETNTNGDYTGRRQFTFQLTKRVFEEDETSAKDLTDTSAREVASIMETRLAKANITSYDISTSGKDIINVTFAANNDEEYSNTITYLAFSGSFALVNASDDIVTGEDFLRSHAYVKDYEVNEYPTVIIPIKTDAPDYPSLIENAKANPVSTSTSDDDEGESVARLYLLYNWQPGETYQTLGDRLQSKTLFTIDFDPDSEEGLYYNSDKNSFSRVCGFQDKNGNDLADPDEVRAAYKQADYLVNLFSASAYDYEVKCIRGLSDNTGIVLEPKVETLLDANHRLVWNRTMTAVVAGIVIVTLLLAFFYKLGALSAATTTLTSLFFAVLILVKTGLEYNLLAVVGLIAVGLVSLVSSVIYCQKLKEDCYKGHTLKKANTEASKKSLLPIVDIHIVTIVLGVMIYLLGGASLRSFSSILALGSLVSLILNTLGLKGLMWLVTNATALNGRYDLFGMNNENIPDYRSEEKPKYQGAYENKNFGKHKKAIGIVTAVALLGSIAGMIAASALRGGELLKKPTAKVTGSEIYVYNRIIQKDSEDKSPLDDTTLQTILDSILIQKNPKVAIDQSEVVPEGEKPTTYTVLSDFIDEKTLFARSESQYILKDNITENYLDTYFILSLNTNLKGTEIAEIKGELPPEDPDTLNDIFAKYFDETSTFSASKSNSLELKQIKTVVNSTNTRWDKVLLATSVSILILTVYLMLRYRLTRGIAALLFPAVSMILTYGLILLLNLVVTVPANAYVAVAIVPLFAYFFMTMFFNKEREMLNDEKVKDNSVEHREEVAKHAIGIAYTPILSSAVIGIYVLINFFGFGPQEMSIAYVASFVGSIIALALICTLIVPVCNILFKWFSKIKIERKPRSNKKNTKPVRKSAEPEEAIFIGIND